MYLFALNVAITVGLVLVTQWIRLSVWPAFKVLSSLMGTALNALTPTVHPVNLPTLPHALLVNNHSCSPTHHARTACQTVKPAQVLPHVIPAAKVTCWSGPKMVRSLAWNAFMVATIVSQWVHADFVTLVTTKTRRINAFDVAKTAESAHQAKTVHPATLGMIYFMEIA